MTKTGISLSTTKKNVVKSLAVGAAVSGLMDAVTTSVFAIHFGKKVQKSISGLARRQADNGDGDEYQGLSEWMKEHSIPEHDFQFHLEGNIRESLESTPEGYQRFSDWTESDESDENAFRVGEVDLSRWSLADVERDYKFLGKGSFGSVYDLAGVANLQDGSGRRLVVASSGKTERTESFVGKLMTRKKACEQDLPKLFGSVAREACEEFLEGKTGFDANLFANPVAGWENFEGINRPIAFGKMEDPTWVMVVMEKAGNAEVFEYIEKVKKREFKDDDQNISTGVIRDADIWKILKDVATGLRTIHDNGLVLADLKSENVMVSYDESTGKVFGAQIIDFGLAMENTNSHETQRGSPLFVPFSLCQEVPIVPGWSYGRLMYNSQESDWFAFGGLIGDLLTNNDFLVVRLGKDLPAGLESLTKQTQGSHMTQWKTDLLEKVARPLLKDHAVQKSWSEGKNYPMEYVVLDYEVSARVNQWLDGHQPY